MKLFKKNICCLSLILLFLSISLPSTDASIVCEASASGTVWICGGPNSKRYHRIKNCPGLSKCSKNPSKLSLNKAKQRGYTPCKKCY